MVIGSLERGIGLKDLTVVSEGAIPIGMQIKEQIRWQIATGEMAPGDPLPSVRELSDCLGVARNTMIAVYDELRAEGLLLVGRGRSTVVAESEAVTQLRSLAGLLQILDGAFDSALAQGFSPDEIRSAAQARAQLFAATAQGDHRLTFVDSTLHDFKFFARQIKESAGLLVKGVDVTHLRNHPILAGDWVVAPCYQAEAVREAVRPETEVLVLGMRLGIRDIMAMLQVAPGTLAVVVGHTRRSAEWVRAEAIREGAPTDLQAVGLDEPEAMALLGQAGAVFAFPSTYEELLGEGIEPSKIRRLKVSLDTGTQESLKVLARRITP